MASAAENAGLIRGFGAATEAHSILHLQFADTLIFSGARVDHIQNVKATLIYFEAVSGMRVDFSKSELIGLQVDSSLQTQLAAVLGSKTGQLPVSYHGLPLCSGKAKKSVWNPVLEKLEKKAIKVVGYIPFSWWWDNLNQVSPL